MNLEKILRVVKLEKQNGFFNTALDEALLMSLSEGKSPPTLAITKWEPTISVGRSQSIGLDVDKNAAKKHEAVILRRKSGGQAVYLDDGYIVFSLIAPKGYFPKGFDELRKSVSTVIANTLKAFNVPAEFYEPDNVVIRKNGSVKTIGNSGQLIGKDFVNVHGSVRYDLKDFDKMMDVLKINGQKINQYKEDIKKHLGYVKQYCNGKSREELEQALVKNLSMEFGTKSENGVFSDEETSLINRFVREKYQENSWNYPSNQKEKSRGICYLFLNGKNIVSSLKPLLAENKPSGLEEARV